jgi:hypothetical protein
MQWDKTVRKVLSVTMLSSILLVVQLPFSSAEIKGLPSWVNELRSRVAQAFHTTVEISRINNQDYVEGEEYAVIRLEGEGTLKKVSDPFEVMRKLFLSNGWKEDWRYAADGHGSSSIAYRKKTCFCIVSVWIDSSCDDEETGHLSSVFGFSIDCRG